MKRVLIAPAPMRDLDPAYGPTLRAAGCELVFPARHGQMTESELLAELPGCAAALAGSEPYTRRVIEAAAANGLRAVVRAGVGYDAIDLDAASDCGVAVGFAPGSNHEAVAEHTFLLILALAKNLLSQHAATAAGEWPRRPTRPIRGTTLGIVGLGRVGRAVAERGVAFGMRVIACEPYPDPGFLARYSIPLLPLDDVLKQADWVSLHCPLTPQTKHLVNADTLGKMNPSAYLINTARGGVVYERDLAAALRDERIAGAGLDVFADEPLPPNHPFAALPNVVLTAHTAGVDLKSRDEMAGTAAKAIVKLLAGDWPAEWIVNPEVKEKWKAGVAK